MANKTITFGADLLPNSTSKEFSLGSSEKKWNIYGDLTGTSTTATNLASAPTLTATGTSTIDLTSNKTYKLTVGGQDLIFKTPPDASSTNTASKIFLIGATSQASGVQTYSTTYVHATAGLLSAKSFAINNNSSTNYVTLQWNATDESLDFVFA